MVEVQAGRILGVRVDKVVLVVALENVAGELGGKVGEDIGSGLQGMEGLVGKTLVLVGETPVLYLSICISSC